jgi:hypothetical protein
MFVSELQFINICHAIRIVFEDDHFMKGVLIGAMYTISPADSYLVLSHKRGSVREVFPSDCSSLDVSVSRISDQLSAAPHGDFCRCHSARHGAIPPSASVGEAL